MSSSSCRVLSVALQAPIASSSLSSSSSSLTPSSSRGRRPRRVLFPTCQCWRPPLREAPDRALRWLLLLCALVFLQIYTEETCTDLSSQSPGVAASQPLQDDGGLVAMQGWTVEDPWKVQTMSDISDTQPECMVA